MLYKLVGRYGDEYIKIKCINNEVPIPLKIASQIQQIKRLIIKQINDCLDLGNTNELKILKCVVNPTPQNIYYIFMYSDDLNDDIRKMIVPPIGLDNNVDNIPKSSDKSSIENPINFENKHNEMEFTTKEVVGTGDNVENITKNITEDEESKITHEKNETDESKQLISEEQFSVVTDYAVKKDKSSYKHIYTELNVVPTSKKHLNAILYEYFMRHADILNDKHDIHSYKQINELSTIGFQLIGIDIIPCDKFIKLLYGEIYLEAAVHFEISRENKSLFGEYANKSFFYELSEEAKNAHNKESTVRCQLVYLRCNTYPVTFGDNKKILFWSYSSVEYFVNDLVIPMFRDKINAHLKKIAIEKILKIQNIDEEFL